MHRVYDIDHAKDILRAKPRPLITFEVDPYARFLGDTPEAPGADRVWDGAIHVDWDRVLAPSNVSLATPVILATTDGGTVPIDGWHRIALARCKGVPKLMGVQLDREETDLVRRPYLKSRMRWA